MWSAPPPRPRTTADTPGILLSLIHPDELRAFAHRPLPSIIDLKDPSAGSLGMPPLSTVRGVAERLAGGATLSVAIGDAEDRPDHYARLAAEAARAGADIVKVGLFGFQDAAREAAFLAALKKNLAVAAPRTRLVAGVYADRATPARARESLLAAAGAGAHGLLLDTYGKDGRNLFHWYSPADCAALAEEGRRYSLFLALAGGLTVDDVPMALGAGGGYVGFRSAVASGARGESGISADKVEGLYRAFGYAAGSGSSGGSLGAGASRSSAGRVAR